MSDRDRDEIGTRAEIGKRAIERCHTEERAIARVRAPYRERPSHRPIEPALPRDAFEEERRDRDAPPRLARDDEERSR